MQNNFNLIAPVYDFLAGLVFGKAIRNSQTWLLPFIPENATVLIIGGGTGWILEEILKNGKSGKILYLEASGKMLEISRKRYAKMPEKYKGQVEFRLGTEHVLAETDKFDVIFTGFLLDLFQPENLQKLMATLFSHLNPDGRWLVADFHPQNAINFWQKSLFKTMVQFFKLTANLQANQLPDIAKTFANFPLELQLQKYFYQNLIRSAVYKK